MSRERSRITKGVVLVALAFSFAGSTAIFNTTYEKQAGVDASLTNGADVAITGTIDAPASGEAETIAAINGVAHVEPMQHRFAYVGTDLQDLYGVDPSTIGLATPMSNAYFENGDAAATLARLRATSDGVLVSDEVSARPLEAPVDGVVHPAISTGDQDDVRTLMHEMGHAFQKWESQPIEDVDAIVVCGFLGYDLRPFNLKFLYAPSALALVIQSLRFENGFCCLSTTGLSGSDRTRAFAWGWAWW